VTEDEFGWSRLLGMGAAIAGAVVLGGGLGWLVDSVADTTPIFLFLGLALGVGGAIRYTVIEFRRYLKTEK
jgi:F0F1-type ATP synthase assembly protein I